MEKVQFDKNNIIGVYSSGIESIIYYYRLGSDVVFLKLLNNFLSFGNESKKVSDETFLNKEKKIEIIPSIDCLKDEVKILKSVYIDDKFSGYIMPIDHNYLYNATDIRSRKAKINILKQLKEKIEKFNNNGIYIGDIKDKNILVSKDGTIKLCDLDNIKIDNFDIDTPSLFTNVYREACSKDDNLDCYCFNLFTLCFLENIYEPYIVYNLIQFLHLGLPRYLNTSENTKILENTIKINDNYEKDYFIDHIK